MVSFIKKSSDGTTDDRRTIEQMVAYLPAGEYVITVEPKRQWQSRLPRSNDQNALMWAFFKDIARLLCMEYGDDYWDAQRVHDYFCMLFADDETAPDGTPWRRPLRTSRLKKQQMSEFLERVQANLAAEHGMRVPLPSDDDYIEFHNAVN